MTPLGFGTGTPHALSRHGSLSQRRTATGSVAATSGTTTQRRQNSLTAVPVEEDFPLATDGHESANPAVPPPRGITPSMREKAKQLRMLPAVAMQALEIAKCPDCTIDEFASLVERDVKLTVDMLRMANSVLWGGRREIGNIRGAVVRLGFRQCRNLILSSSMASLMNRIGKQERSIREVLQQHAFVTASLAAHLNRQFDLGFGGDEFTAGLIHDIGRVVMAVSVTPQSPHVDTLTFDESEETLAREDEAFGTNHCELGAWYVAANRFPEELVEVVRYHHQPHLASRNFALTALVSVCDHMANHWQRFGSLDDYQPDSNDALKILEVYAVLELTTNLVAFTRPIIEAAIREANELMAACAG